MSKTKSTTSIVKKHEYTKPILQLILSFIVDLISFIILFHEVITIYKCTTNKTFPTVLFLVLIVISLIQFWLLLFNVRTHKKYKSIVIERELSEAALHALEHTEEAKKRYVLQSTYGNVPEWHPTDYTRNVLIYDVHEQIRTILFNLRDAIIHTIKGLNEDQITVDFVYCYPSASYAGNLPYETQPPAEPYPWRLITSGNHSLGGSMKEYLSKKDSFFTYVAQKGYVFCNNKHNLVDKCYIPSCKDNVFNYQGSIIGLMFELRNDAPESVFIKGILTITTYGKNLYEKKSVSLEQFKAIFKDNFLNCFESSLYSELIQMYIRHAIRDGEICPKTGRHASRFTTESKSTNPISIRICPWTQKTCKFINTCCKDFYCQLPQGADNPPLALNINKPIPNI